MINYKEAVDIISRLEYATPEIEQLELVNALGRVLAENIYADTDMPPFDKSAMDGYACKRADLNKSLSVVDNIPAGKSPSRSIIEGQCSKVMTGAKIPTGADCVIKIENVEVNRIGEVSFKASETKNNICYQGEDIRKGNLVLKHGTRLQTQDLAILASFGCTKPLVYKQVSVGILCSGTELIEPDHTPHGVSIRNSNAYQLQAQVQAAGGIARYYGIANDEEDLLDSMISEMLSENSIVIVTGGASVGDYDFIEDIFKRKGFKIHFTQTAIQPGKPVIMASTDTKHCIGLSGNPVSSYLQFELFVRPMLGRTCGQNYQLPLADIKSKQDLKCKRNGRDTFIPVKLDENGALRLIDFHGSAHIAALSEAFGFAILNNGESIRKGDTVQVLMINTR